MTDVLAQSIELNESTARAARSTVLTPNFYTTDHTAMDKIDLTPVRAEWDAMMAEFRGDANIDHFSRDGDFRAEVEAIPPALREEFLDFLVSSCTSEYSGCVLYAEIMKRSKNPDMKELFELMSRDEARHANFLNLSLRDFDLAVDLKLLKQVKKYKYFSPKFIMYTVYLSEKIGYARYITIFRHLERNPHLRFHPIFKWFHRWCNDEYRHGEAFALMMKAQPALLRGRNRLWIRFFLLAVYATMYVRDHTRPTMSAALGFDPTDYDFKVFRITNEICKQIFPLLLDIEDPRFRANMDRLCRLAAAAEEAKAQGGVWGTLKRWGCVAAAGATLARLFFLPTVEVAPRETVRMAPAW
ncbi:MAG: magnesium-protoporphyrin IX monomethyl ester (oxidative) cyclase [Tagaea sp.]